METRSTGPRDREGINGDIVASEGRKRIRLDKKTWATYRPILEKLYMDEKKGLPAVMKYMTERSNFRATQKQCMLIHLTVYCEREVLDLMRSKYEVYRYQFGVRWGWKKYNLGVMKSSKSPSHRARLQSGPSVSSEDANTSEVRGRDIASLRELLSKLFTNPSLDKESLMMLRQGDLGVVSQCVRLFFDWCDKEIQKTPLSFQYMEVVEAEMDNSDSKYGLDVDLFLYLLDRYIRSQDSSSEHHDWEDLAEKIKFCPIKMLFIMSTLIVVVVSRARDLRQEEILFKTPYACGVAKFGIDEISRNGWRNKKLVTEFCNEFESILKDYANYGNEFKFALSRYMTQEWSETQENESLGLEDGEEPDFVMWSDNIQDEGLCLPYCG